MTKELFECNCLIWVIKQRITQGGKILWKKSRTWWGFHTTWQSPQGDEYEYTLKVIKKHPWWYVPFCYHGVVKKVKKKQSGQS